MRFVPAALALTLLLAGCAELVDRTPRVGDDPTEPEEWQLGGAWTAEHTQADLDAWCVIAMEYGNGCQIMESFPPQYRLTFTSEGQCREARGRILALDHITAGECARVPAPSGEPDTPTSTTPPTPRSSDGRELAVRTFALNWSDPARPDRTSAMRWEVVSAWIDATGLVTIETTTHGIEGGDFRFTLRDRTREPFGGVSFYARGAPEPGTFDFDYTEAAFWAGRAVTHVESVDALSYVRTEGLDAAKGSVQGTFLLDFVGSCDEGDFNCASPGTPRRTVLEGRFGP